MVNTKTGYVYILTNPSFKEDWVKIGKSTRPVNVRSKELDNTAVPLPFEMYAAIKTTKYNEVEKLVHKTIDRLTDLRIRQNREFFNVPPQVAFDIFKDIASTIEDAELIEYKTANTDSNDDNADECSHTKRERFRFSMVGIKIGSKITFVPTGTVVKVVSDNTVEYKGRIYKLSPFAGTYMPKNKRNASNAYQGSKFFSFRGKILEDLRKEAEGR
ncbi:MAG: GIY-YIG nuclease family protein [Opitutales bacterium]|nr:GIY-YIG nuclease family protein [Opitutales bacterium]